VDAILAGSQQKRKERVAALRRSEGWGEGCKEQRRLHEATVRCHHLRASDGALSKACPFSLPVALVVPLVCRCRPCVSAHLVTATPRRRAPSHRASPSVRMQRSTFNHHRHSLLLPLRYVPSNLKNGGR